MEIKVHCRVGVKVLLQVGISAYSLFVSRRLTIGSGVTDETLGRRHPDGISLLWGEEDRFPVGVFDKNSVLVWVSGRNIH